MSNATSEPDEGVLTRRYLNVPIPDPSTITSREIERAKSELRAEFKALLASQTVLESESRRYIKEIIETRLDGMDKAHVLIQDDVKRAVTECATNTMQLSHLFEEKLNGILTRFDGIAVQFRERDIRTDQDKIAASTAVNAALQAQKEAAGAQNESNAAAITKSENSFTKEIDGLKSLINATKDTIQSQISNLTGRLDRGEGGEAGVRQTKQDSRGNMQLAVAVAALVFAIVSGFVGFSLGHNGGGSGVVAVAPAVAPLYPTPAR
jgi:hypothetical protein